MLWGYSQGAGKFLEKVQLHVDLESFRSTYRWSLS
jgi:hypothetical protein